MVEVHTWAHSSGVTSLPRFPVYLAMSTSLLEQYGQQAGE